MISDFNHENFLTQLSQVAKEINQQYQPMLNVYQQYLIPFERSLRNNSLQYNSNYNQKEKIQLLTKVELLQKQKNRLEVDLQEQKNRLKQLQDDIQIQEAAILKLKHENEDAEANINDLIKNLQQKSKAVANLSADKSHLLKQIQERSNEYNRLLESFMKEKNTQADRINQWNDMEQKMLEKQKKIDEDRFYLDTQIKKFEEERKALLDQIKNLKQANANGITNNIIKKPSIKIAVSMQQPQHNEKERKNMRSELAKTPLKKITKHHTSEIYCLTSSFNGNTLASCGGDRYIKFYDPINLKTNTTIQSNSAESIFISLHLNYLGDRVIAGSTDKGVYIFNSNVGKQLNCFMGHGQKVNAVAFTNAKQKCVSGGDDRQLKFWDIEKGSNHLSISCGRSVKIITPNYAQPIIYTGHGDGSIRIYSTSQGNKPLSEINGLLDYAISSISLSSNRNQILVGSKQGSTINMVDLRTRKILKSYEDKQFYNAGEHFKADFSPSERHLVAGTCDGNIMYWDVDTQKRQGKLTGHQGSVTSVLYHPFTSILATSDSKGNLILWN